MVAAVDRALRDALGTQGLLDPDVLLLDPACGTGTFLIAALNLVAQVAHDTMGEGAVAAEVAALASRLHGLELLVGPYTVAHYRVLREVAAHGVIPTRRLPIYLADTLTPPAGAAGITPHLGFMAAPIVAERQEAGALKRDKPIIAILGNPPYRRLGEGEEQALTRGWDNGFWEDLKDPVRRAGWGGELNTFPDLYIAFWRWSLWKLFESDGAPGRGVVCLITNRTFLAGHPYAGLRRMLRQRFDTIDIIDLRGDSRGARPAGIDTDENVFAIQAGVCITIAVATGQSRLRATEARIRYADVWRNGVFAAGEKRALLDAARDVQNTLSFVDIGGGDLRDFVPNAFEGLDWPILLNCFTYKGYGVKTQHDDIAYDLSRDALAAKLYGFVREGDIDRARTQFKDSRKNKTENARAEPIVPNLIREISFRPFDRRWLYRHSRFVDEMANRTSLVWGERNSAICALPSGTGAGPAIWVHGLLPDYHSFRGSYGGYAFPLWDRRNGPAAHNLTPALLVGLGATYGITPTPQQVFDAIVALLSAPSYSMCFAWDLEEAFAHIPFPTDAATFAEAVRIGAEIRALETFARGPAPSYHSARLAGRASGVTLGIPPTVRAFRADDRGTGAVALQEDQSLRLDRLPEPVWQFAVSGYRVLPRWLVARNGEAIDAALQRAILDIAWRIEELLYWFSVADTVLAQAIAAPLTRYDLGLPDPRPTTPSANEQ